MLIFLKKNYAEYEYEYEFKFEYLFLNFSKI